MSRIIGADNLLITTGRVPGPEQSVASGTAVMPGPAGQQDADVSTWSVKDKIAEAVRCSLGFLGPDLRKQAEALLSWQGIALMAATAGAQFVPVVGEFLDLGVTLYIWVTFGREVVMNTKAFFLGAIRARRYSELKEAGHALSQVITAIGAMRFLELLHDMGGKSADEAAETHVIEELKPEVKAPTEEVPPAAAPELEQLIPLNRNPRQLAKHPGQVSVAKLVEEIMSKGFQKVKGEHGELEGVYARRIRRGEQDYFETVRIDPPEKKPWTPTGKTVSSVQASKNSAFRRDHLLNEAPATPQGKALSDQLGQGRKSDSFAHWHHEMLPAKPKNLQNYIAKDWKTRALTVGIEKLDFSNQTIRGSRR